MGYRVGAKFRARCESKQLYGAYMRHRLRGEHLQTEQVICSSQF